MARLRYQQTKVDDVIPTILVEQAIVDIIREQQDWLNTNALVALYWPTLSAAQVEHANVLDVGASHARFEVLSELDALEQ